MRKGIGPWYFFTGHDFLLDAKCSRVLKRSPEAPMRLCSVMTRFTWIDIPGQFVSFKSQMNPLNSLPLWNYKSNNVSADFQWTVINSMAVGITRDCFIPSGEQTPLFSTPRLALTSTTSPPPTVALPRYRTGTVDRITSVQPGKTAASLMQLTNCILQQQKKKK